VTAVLEARGLAKRFGGVTAVGGVDLAVAAGEVVALIGPNGAGKSTCFNMLMGQIHPDAGRVAVLGRDVTGWPPRRVWRLGVGRTFQVAQALVSFTAAENVQVALLSKCRRLLSLLRRASPLYREEALELLRQVGMADLADRRCALLAYGDLKRLELAVALANRPRLLLMDEPTAGMAPTERRDLMQLVAQMARTQGMAVLFTEHDMDIVFGHADRVLVMSHGRLIAAGTPEAVRADPEVQAVYLGAPAAAPAS
jgi:branched-chain amino acid transport system ATP-binding protein